LDHVNLNMPVDKSKSYADSQRELTNLAKELAASLAIMVQSSKNSPIEVGENARKVAAIIPKFVDHTRDAISTISEIEIRKGLLESARNVVATSEKLIKGSKTMASDTKSVKTQQLLSATYKEVTESISQLVFAIKTGATGEIKCEEAVENINRRIGELDGAALFAATGQLQKEGGEVELDEVQRSIGNALL
jgi:gas vesicle protein